MLFYTHLDCLKHVMQPSHPESPARLKAVTDYLTASGLLAEFDVREPSPIDPARLQGVHDRAYLQLVVDTDPDEGLAAIDADSLMCPHTLQAASLAAGAVVSAVEEVLSGDVKRAFCAVRPPGHHAEADAGMGFCFYNSVALGADAALKTQGVDRVAILDFDVHHGNGTVDIFKDRPEVLVCSSFQHPHYPFRHSDTVRDNIINTPLAAGTAGLGFRKAIEQDWGRALDAFKPNFILISAGFDAHRLDPLADLLLNESDYRWVTEYIVDFARRYCDGRIVSTLEGGYDLSALASSVHTHLEVLAIP